MTMHHEFESRLADAWDPAASRDLTVLVAVSGGADSVALLRGLIALSGESARHLAVVHVNHHLRGRESDGDEQFVRGLCEHLNLPCEVMHVQLAGAGSGGSLEALVRRERYRLLCEAAGRRGARYVATAHTADDQAETILHRVLRGTGLTGLAGIPFTRRLSEWTTVVRPLLGVSRQEVVAYLRECRQSFRQDSSNQQTSFTRNRIRHQLLPILIRDYNPRVVPALLRLGNAAQQARQLVETLVEPLWQAAVTSHGLGHVEVARAALRDQPPFLVRELLLRIWMAQHWPLQDMSEAKWLQLCQLVQGEPSAKGPARITLPGNIDATAHRETLSLGQNGESVR